MIALTVAQEPFAVYKIQVITNRGNKSTMTRIDADGMIRFDEIYRLTNELGCPFIDCIENLSSATHRDFYTRKEECTKLDFAKLVTDVNALEITDEVVDAWKAKEGIPSQVDIYRSDFTISSIKSSTVRTDYPAECINDTETVELECYTEAKPQCDLLCGAGTECDPKNADKYCTKYGGCILADEVENIYVCGSSASALYIIASVAVSIAAALAVIF